jgi:hypothetical protein
MVMVIRPAGGGGGRGQGGAHHTDPTLLLNARDGLSPVIVTSTLIVTCVMGGDAPQEVEGDEDKRTI